MSIRVLVLIPSYLPVVGGAEVAAASIAERLTAVEFVVVCGRLRGELARFERVGRADVHRIGPGARADAWLLPLLAPPKALRLGAFDVVHAFGANQAAAAGYLLSVLRPATPFLLSLVGTSEDLEKARRRFGPVYNRLHRRATAVHALTSWHEQAARDLGYTGPVARIPFGADLRRFGSGDRDSARRSLGLDDSSFVVVTTARLVPRKRIDDVIRALVHLAPDTVAVVAGDGPQRAELEALASRVGVAGRVRFLGRVDDARVAEVLRAGDVFVLPSTAEGFGIATVEAMASGLPVVVAPVDGVRDVVPDEQVGLWCAPRDAGSVASCIRRLRADPALRDRLAAAGRRRAAERYDWDEIASSFERLYRDLSTAHR